MTILTDPNYFSGFATLITGLVAIGLYYWEQRGKKQDAAKIIIQEIRRAEDLINEYKEHGSYKFTKKIIATNSWAKNIHYFVSDLPQDGVDKISNLYSTGEYLDSIIAKVSDQVFEDQVNSYKAEINQVATQLQNNQNPTASITANPQSVVQASQQPVGIQKVVPVKINIPAPWKVLLDEISYKYEPIYNSDICLKLKNIAKVK